MSRFRRVGLAAALAVVPLSLRQADVCGPFLPHKLFLDRAATLANLPERAMTMQIR